MKKTERKKAKKAMKQWAKTYEKYFKSATAKQPTETLSIVDEIKLEKLKKGEKL